MQLDARQRAMLDEIGVKVWWPVHEPVAVPVAEPVAEAPPLAIKKVATNARPAGAAASFDTKTAAPPAGTDLWLESQPRRLYGSESAPQGGWLVAVDMPPGADGRHGEPLEGDAGRLLDNMLRALQLDRGTAPVHVLRVHRGAPGPEGASRPLAEGFAAQVEALAPRVVLALGPLAAQHLFGRAEPLGKLRGRVEASARCPGAALVASYPPVYLLRNQADKAKAWVDLCLAAQAFEQAPG